MTLRESANSFIQAVNLAVDKGLFNSEDFSTDKWNCLHADVARQYILQNLVILGYDIWLYHSDYDNSFSLHINKIDIKTPISSLGLDNEFDWSNITLN